MTLGQVLAVLAGSAVAAQELANPGGRYPRFQTLSYGTLGWSSRTVGGMGAARLNGRRQRDRSIQGRDPRQTPGLSHGQACP